MNVKALSPLLAAGACVLLTYCALTPEPADVISRRYPGDLTQASTPYRGDASSYTPSRTSTNRPATNSNSTAGRTNLKVGINLQTKYMPRSARGRNGRSMRPRYITIHSTQNWSKGADAYRHSLALNRGKLGRISWHFTTDENVAIQHLPTTEQGNHADHDGPGNHYSIGIEMCEHPGNSRAATMDRTAKLTAYLMKKHNIPLHNVKPHYHWPRWGKNPPNKNCPHFLMTNGKPGAKWNNFVSVVGRYYNNGY